MSHKFTPGKWIIDDKDSGVYVGVYNPQYVGDFKPIAHICPQNLDFGDPRRANVFLIRAAPEMLNALELIVDRLLMDDMSAYGQDQVDAILNAQLVLKSALGEK